MSVEAPLEAVTAEPLIRLSHVYKVYRRGDTGVAALGGVSLDVWSGEFVAVVGPSGAGKSSILNLVGGLDQATAGEVRVAGQDLAMLSDAELTRYRRDRVGFVWQGTARNLVPYLTLSANVDVPLLAAGVDRPARASRVAELLELAGLSQRAGHLPWMLSGGEQQRAAVAVALANLPLLVLADEPTAELDTASADRVLAAFRSARDELGTTIVMVTHDLVAAARADRAVRVLDGRVRHDAGLAALDADGRLTLPASALAALFAEGSEIGVEVSGGEVHLRGRKPLPHG
ncbi:MAG TPA: ABC transporter ATP-binding protein [Actinomycetota bacterium]|nr:ABC transporter ATP-binding protein [Actinomycetota bacterium]